MYAEDGGDVNHCHSLYVERRRRRRRRERQEKKEKRTTGKEGEENDRKRRRRERQEKKEKGGSRSKVMSYEQKKQTKNTPGDVWSAHVDVAGKSNMLKS